MISQRALVRAPSNIALIKYMGKKDGGRNLPENPSLSVTLNGLCTWLELKPSRNNGPQWFAETPAGAPADARPPALSERGRARFLEHAERVRAAAPELLERFGLALGEASQGYELRAANTFPTASGIASSASSFAALTLAMSCACAADSGAFVRIHESRDEGVALRRELAKLSREGSGSSCRSFEGPWVAWDGEGAEALGASTALAHFVLLASSGEKAVSSSEAHSRVKGSPLWPERPRRATERFQELRQALDAGDLGLVARLSWVEAWDMHGLFHTASEPFTYWEPVTVAVLKTLATQLGRDRPPIVTLDAGPNVHLLCELSERERWREYLRAKFPSIPFLEDSSGHGAVVLEAGAC